MEHTRPPSDSTAKASGRILLQGTAVVGSLTLLSRVLGFVRDLLVARLLGTGAAADAFNVAFRIPNLLRSIFAEGALTSAFVPVLATELQLSVESARVTVRAIATVLFGVTTLLSAVGIFYAPLIVDLIAPGFQVHDIEGSFDKFALCVALTRIMLPYIVFVSIVAMLNGALNSVEIFGASAWAQVLMNCVLIVGALLASMSEEMTRASTILAWSVVAGGAVQVVAQLPLLARAGFSLRPLLRCWIPATREIVVLMAPAVLGAAVYQVTMFIATALASLVENGAVSWLFYADRLTQLPIGIFSIALASVLLPVLARAHSRGAESEFSDRLNDSLRFTSFFIIPTCGALFLFAEPLVRILFERGAFSPRSTTQTALAVMALAPGIWAASCHSLLARALIARKDTLTTALIGIATLSVTVVTATLVMGSPVEGAAGSIATMVRGLRAFALSVGLEPLSWGHVGIALSSTVASLFALSAMAILLMRRLPTITMLPFLRASATSGVATVLAAMTTAYAKSLIMAIPLFIAVLLVLLWLLRSRELRESSSLIRARLRRNPRPS